MGSAPGPRETLGAFAVGLFVRGKAAIRRAGRWARTGESLRAGLKAFGFNTSM